MGLDGDGGHTNQLVQIADQVSTAVLLNDDGRPGLLQGCCCNGFPWGGGERRVAVLSGTSVSTCQGGVCLCLGLHPLI